MMHRDGSATFCPTEGRYISCADHDENSSIPAPTREEIIKEANEVKEEHRQYLASPIKYWKGVRTDPRRRRQPDLAWLFPMYVVLSRRFDYSHDDTSCDCGDRYLTVDDDYPSWEDGYGDELDHGLGYDPYYEFHFEEDRDSEDDEENEEGDYTDDDRSSLSPDEHEPTVKEEDDKTTVRMADIKQEIKEETHHELVSGHLTVLKVEQEGTPSFTSTPDPVASGSAVTASGTGDQAPRDPEVGPAVQTEGKRVSYLRSPGSANPCLTTARRSCEATGLNHTRLKSPQAEPRVNLFTVWTTM